MQRALDEHRRRHGFAPQVRIGLHATAATPDGNDWSGVGVHVAARISAIAEGAEILLSAETAAAALGSGWTVSPARLVQLKGITKPVEVVTVDWRKT
jgi:class 3 adenylate cyclase